MAKKYKNINYDQYVAFINTVVSNTVQSGGYEYKRFWATLAFAMIFEDYKPTHFKKSDDGERDIILINEEWNEIKNIDPLVSGYDPVIIAEMYKIVDKKLDKIFGKSDVELAVTGLLTSVTSFVNDMEEQFKNTNVEEQMATITMLSDKLKNMDSKTIASFMANVAHQQTVELTTSPTKDQ